MSFQKTVNSQPSPGVEGAIASSNYPALYVTGPGGLVTGANGANIGRFGWATAQTSVGGSIAGERVDSNALLTPDGEDRAPDGFLANEQQGLFTTYLAESGLTMLAGQACELFTRGDFWMKAAAAITTRNLKVFANMLDGTAQSGAAGTVVAGIAITASFATNVMTVTAGAGLLPGMAVTGTTVPASTYIKAQTGGTAGGAGTYTLSTTPGTIASQSNTATAWVETKFRALSTALINEIFKIGFGD